MTRFGCMIQSTCRDQMHWLLLSGVVLVVDQLTKFLASKHLVYGVSKVVMPGVHLTLLHNTGAAFSLLAHAGGWQNILFVAIALMVSGFIVLQLIKIQGKPKVLALGLACVLGGALGNTWDRLSHNYVIDFIDLNIGHYHWPAFNVADAAICLGALLWCLISWRQSQSTV